MNNTNQVSFLKKYKFPILWAGFIMLACGANPGTFQTLHLTDLFAYDKPIHAILFGVQAWLIVRAQMKHGFRGSYAAMVARACILSAMYGALIEVLQLFFFEGRSYDYFDMIADAVGAIVVWIWLLRKSARVQAAIGPHLSDS